MQIRFLGLIILISILSGCTSTEPVINPQPEISPICPEGFYRIDTSKSCEILQDDLSQ